MRLTRILVVEDETIVALDVKVGLGDGGSRDGLALMLCSNKITRLSSRAIFSPRTPAKHPIRIGPTPRIPLLRKVGKVDRMMPASA